MFNAYDNYNYEQNYQIYPFCNDDNDKDNNNNINNNYPDDWHFHKRYLNLQTPDERFLENPNGGPEPASTTPSTKTLKQAIASLNVMYSAANEDIPLQNYTAESDIGINDLLMGANSKRRRLRKAAMARRIADPKKLEMSNWLKHMDEWYTAEMQKDCPKLMLNHRKDRKVRIAQLQRC
uniref:Uncharacterized protein n=1 Tax=Zeugodacus cucurbitae TaxID=28588 RepID=A0A0A1XAH7_ZEUCU